MATNFPGSLDNSSTLPAESAVTTLATNHVIAHQNLQDAVEAIEAKIGVDSSAVTTSHDYKLSEVISTDTAVGKTATQTLTNKTLTSPVINVGSDATGDIYYRNAGVLTRLPIGTDNHILKINGTVPNWEAETSVIAATESAEGISRLATAAQITAGTASEASYPLVVTPDQLALSTPVFNGSGLINLPASVYYATASANLKISADTERTTSSVGLFLVKSIRPSYGGVIRVAHEMKNSSAGFDVNSRIYVNGVATGTARNTQSTTYVSYSEDITINPGDQVQLYFGSTDVSRTCYVQNFRVSFDKTSAGDGYTITD